MKLTTAIQLAGLMGMRLMHCQEHHQGHPETLNLHTTNPKAHLEVRRTASCTSPSRCAWLRDSRRPRLGRARATLTSPLLLLAPSPLLSASTTAGASSGVIVAPGRDGARCREAARSKGTSAGAPGSCAGSPCSCRVKTS